MSVFLGYFFHFDHHDDANNYDDLSLINGYGDVMYNFFFLNLMSGYWLVLIFAASPFFPFNIPSYLRDWQSFFPFFLFRC